MVHHASAMLKVNAKVNATTADGYNNFQFSTLSITRFAAIDARLLRSMAGINNKLTNLVFTTDYR
jgi:hypothetical protein